MNAKLISKEEMWNGFEVEIGEILEPFVKVYPVKPRPDDGSIDWFYWLAKDLDYNV